MERDAASRGAAAEAAEAEADFVRMISCVDSMCAAIFIIVGGFPPKTRVYYPTANGRMPCNIPPNACGWS
jgi:hypothetical protein